MILGKYIKTPDERKRYSVDYSHWLDAGETITGVGFEIIPEEALGVVINGSQVESPATGIAFFVDDGLTDKSYNVVITITTSGGQTKQDELKFTIKGIRGFTGGIAVPSGPTQLIVTYLGGIVTNGGVIVTHL